MKSTPWVASDWGAAYSAHRTQVCAILQKHMMDKLNRRYDAEDFLQEGMLRLLQGRVVLRDSGLNLLTHVARCRQIEALQRITGRAGRYYVPWRETAFPDGFEDELPDKLMSGQELDAIEFLERLKANCKNELEWRLVELKASGCSTPEAARTLGINDRTAQRIIRRLSRVI